jgi:cleavage and polyadenylation specificity factor subunit 1
LEIHSKKRQSGFPAGRKTISWTSDDVSSATTDESHAFLIRDELSGNRLLVDTGAFLSLFPVSLVSSSHIKHTDDIPDLVAANGSQIPTFGRMDINLRLAGKNFTWNFVVASIRQSLLGADFLAHFRLLVDVAGHRLLDSDSFSWMPLYTSRHTGINSSVSTIGPYSYLFEEFKDVFRAELKQTPGASAKHGIYHHISTTGPPVYSRYRRLPPEKLKAAKTAFSEMERMGVCRKASSAWSSPLHMVPKADGSWRPCGDYRRLNTQTVPDHYPLPNIADITATLHGAKIFSKLDLLKGYFQVPVHPDDVDKTCIITPFGSFVFYYSTFGLRNSGATFQRLMDTVFGEISFCIVYVDDILVFSKNSEEHHHHLKTVLGILQDNGLVVRPDKCMFGVESIDFLGHRIDADGIYPLDKKIDAVKEFPRPSTIRSLQEYLGLLNYYHRFIPNLACIIKPLYDSLSGSPKSLDWGQKQEDAFQASKSALGSATCLHHPIPGAPIVVTTDASATGVGAVLEQIINGEHQPLAFFSKKLRSNERKYSTFDRELLAVYLALRHFRHALEGISFKVRTDHKPLVNSLTKSKDLFSLRQQRQLSDISEFSCTLEHISGNKNPAADALSRAAIDEVQLGIDFYELAAEQHADPETESCQTTLTSLQWQDIPLDYNSTILCDVSTGTSRSEMFTEKSF